MDGVPLDALVARMLSMSPFDYRVAAADAERELAYRLRGRTQTVNGRGKNSPQPSRPLTFGRPGSSRDGPKPNVTPARTGKSQQDGRQPRRSG
jgi:hypothetical protein